VCVKVCCGVFRKVLQCDCFARCVLQWMCCRACCCVCSCGVAVQFVVLVCVAVHWQIVFTLRVSMGVLLGVV